MLTNQPNSNNNIAKEQGKILRKELFNIEAEQSVLGTIILNNEYLNRVIEFLVPEYFYEPAHQKIFAQICTALVLPVI